MKEIQETDILLKIESVQSKIIKVLFEVLKDIFLTIVNFTFTKDGIKLKTMNGTEQTIVYLKLEADKFEEYYFKEEKIVVGIDTTNFFKITKNIQSKDIIKIFLLKSEPSNIILQRVNNETKSIYTHYIKIFDIPEENLNISEISYEKCLTLKSNEFQTACKNFNSINCNNVNIYFKNNSIILEGDNNYSSSTVELIQQQEDGDCEDITKLNTPQFQGKYLLQYILLFTKASSLDKNFNIYYNPNRPLTLTFLVGSLGTLDFMLMPLM